MEFAVADAGDRRCVRDEVFGDDLVGDREIAGQVYRPEGRVATNAPSAEAGEN